MPIYIYSSEELGGYIPNPYIISLFICKRFQSDPSILRNVLIVIFMIPRNEFLV